MKKSSLDEIQELFWKNLTSPDVATSEIFSLLTDSIDGTSERMAIYSGGYFLRILGALSEDFKDLRRFLGNENFQKLSREYLNLHLSNHFSLRHMGARLPSFLESHPLNKEFPWIAELAHFEWSKTDLFDGPDHNVVKRKTLVDLPPEQWPQIKFKFVPNFTLLQTQYRVETLTELPESVTAIPKNFEPRPETLKLWRKGEDIFYGLATPEELKMMALVRTGKTFGEIGTEMAESTSQDAAASTVFQILSKWLEDQLIERLEGISF